MKHIFIFIISFLSVIPTAFSQEDTTVVSDSLQRVEKYGLRLGIDLYKPIKTLLDDNYSGFEIMGDFRVYKKYYFALELGNEEKTTFDDNITSKGSGSYAKIGFDYNAHNNWGNLNNMIFVGLRYGFSGFDQELLSYSVATHPIFGDDIRDVSVKYSGLSAHWAELIFGLKTEIFNNLYLSLNLQLKYRLNEKQPENFENLYIPGFGRTYEDSKFGVGFGYGASYLISIFNK